MLSRCDDAEAGLQVFHPHFAEGDACGLVVVLQADVATFGARAAFRLPVLESRWHRLRGVEAGGLDAVERGAWVELTFAEAFPDKVPRTATELVW